MPAKKSEGGGSGVYGTGQAKMGGGYGTPWTAAKSSGRKIPVAGNSGSGVAKTGSAIRGQNSASKSYVSKTPRSQAQIDAAAKNSARMTKVFKKAANSNRKATATGAAGFVAGAAIKKDAPKKAKPSARQVSAKYRASDQARRGK